MNNPFNGCNTYHGATGIIQFMEGSRPGSGLEAATYWLMFGDISPRAIHLMDVYRRICGSPGALNWMLIGMDI